MVPTLPGSCTPSSTSTGEPGAGGDVGERPVARLDHGDDALRMLGVGQLVELAVAHRFDRGPPFRSSARLERLPAGVPSSAGETAAPRSGNAGAERLLDQPDPFGQRQAAALAAAAAVQVPDHRLQGARHGDAHAMKIALTIAGSDSGGGAGIQADLKTFQQFGVFGTSVIVALTAQNTRGVRAVETVPEAMVAAQLAALAEDLPPAALKTGMLAEAVAGRGWSAKAIRENGWAPLVVDPVMVSTSGHRLLTPEAEDVVRESLLPLAALVTPNLDEAAILTGRAVHDVAAMERAGETLLASAPARRWSRAAISRATRSPTSW